MTSVSNSTDDYNAFREFTSIEERHAWLKSCEFFKSLIKQAIIQKSG